VIACPVDHPAIPVLFDPAIADSPVLWAVFERRNTGIALVDNLSRPTQCVLRTDAVLTFASCQAASGFLQDAIAHFRQAGPVWLIWPAEVGFGALEQDTMRVIRRLEFDDCDPASPILDDWRQRLPDGFEIQRITRDMLERCEWREDMEFFCGSLDNFFLNCLGYCMLHGEEIIVEAYASSLGGGKAEIGAITNKAQRGNGYASIACAFLIQTLDRLGYRAYWSCDADNLASIHVAHKLGFQRKKPYLVLDYSHDH